MSCSACNWNIDKQLARKLVRLPVHNGTVDVAQVDVIVFLSLLMACHALCMRMRSTKYCTLEVTSK